jgi:hypothetical protein
MGYFPNVPDFQNVHQFFHIRRAVLILATALLRSKSSASGCGTPAKNLCPMPAERPVGLLVLIA